MADEVIRAARDGNPIKNGGTITLVFNTGTAASGAPLVNQFVSSGTMNTRYGYSYNPDQVRTVGLQADVETKELVSAVAGKKIEVVSYVMVASAASTVTWKSNTTAISSGMPLAANGGVSATNNQGLLRTSAGEALKITNSAGQLNGHISYKIN